MRVSEEASDLCPPQICPRAASEEASISDLLRDAGIVYERPSSRIRSGVWRRGAWVSLTGRWTAQAHQSVVLAWKRRTVSGTATARSSRDGRAGVPTGEPATSRLFAAGGRLTGVPW
jgi:hypothetical protein